MKIVINRCYGTFKLSDEAKKYMGLDSAGRVERNDPKLIECVEALGEKASGGFSYLKIVEIPDDVEWEIEEYDGLEWVSEKHRTWR